MTYRFRLRTAVVGSVLLLSSIPAAQVHGALNAAASSGTVIAAEAETPDTLNPYLTQTLSGHDIIGGVFDQLVRYTDKGQLVGDLATSWSHDASGLHWTFNLVHNATWQDGVSVTAKDIVFTTNLVNNPKFPSTVTQGFDHIKSITAVGDYRVDVTLKSVFAPFLNDWADNAFLPEHVLGNVPPDKIKTLTNFNRTPVGDGPFRISEFVPGDHITEAANPTYFRGAPHLAQIIFRIVPSNNTAVNQIQTGEVNLLGVTSDIAPRQFNQLKAMSGITTYNTQGFNWDHVDLIETGFLKDVPVRQALTYATPKEQIIKSIFLGYGVVQDADQAPGTVWYNPAVKNSYPFSLAKAKALLQQDGFTAGSGGVLQKGGTPFNLTLWCLSDASTDKLTAQILKQEWSSIGVNATIKTEPAAVLFGRTGPLYDPNRLSSPSMNAVIYGWYNGAEPDDTFFWNSSQIVSKTVQAGGNFDGYSNPEVDKLTREGVQVIDTGKRAAIYKQIQVILARDVPDIFIEWGRVLTAATSKLHGYDPQPYETSLTWNAGQWSMTS